MAVTIIAEAGVNHDGKGSRACRLADAAKEAGADIVKFQTFNPNRVFRPGPDRERAWNLVLNTHDSRLLIAHCENIGIEFCSTPDDLDSLKYLVEEAGVKRIKIGSGSLLHEPLVNAAFDTGLPILLSTGMATLAEVRDVVHGQAVRCRNHPELFHNILTVMHCVSLYPCPPELANVSAIVPLREMMSHWWRKELGSVGYSDHTVGYNVAAAAAAVALGATVIEKHFTLDAFRTDGGASPDHAMSATPAEFRRLVNAVREIEAVLGDGRKEPSVAELAMIPLLRKDKDGYQPGLSDESTVETTRAIVERAQQRDLRRGG